MKTTSLLVASLLFLAPNAFAKSTSSKKVATIEKKNATTCETDKKKFCSDESAEGMRRCLQSHETELSDSCRIDLKKPQVSK